jgi:hypothetical protein
MGVLSSLGNVAKSGWDKASHAADDVASGASSAWDSATDAAKSAAHAISSSKGLASQLGHTALDGIGLIPVVGTVSEGINAGWYAAEGDMADAALAGASAIPIAGDFADAARLGKDGLTLARDGVDMARAGETAAHVAQDVHAGETAAKGLTTETAKVGRNEASWTLDAAGRPQHIEGTLRESGSHLERGKAELKAQDNVRTREGARADDDAGHVVGHRFMPGQGEKNMFPQNFNFNRGAYKTMENEWEAWTRKGGEVNFRTDLEGGVPNRPDRVIVDYDVHNANGKLVYDNRVTFQNESGQDFDRVPTKDMDKYLY